MDELIDYDDYPDDIPPVDDPTPSTPVKHPAPVVSSPIPPPPGFPTPTPVPASPETLAKLPIAHALQKLDTFYNN